MNLSKVILIANKNHVFVDCCCSVTKLRLTLCNLMDCSTPDLPVTHHLPVCQALYGNKKLTHLS